MIIDLSKFKIPVRAALVLCGYSYRKDKKDFLREDGDNGRFHIKFEGQYLRLHYDIYVDWRHVSFNLPEYLRKEKGRIKKVMQQHKRDQKNEDTK